MYQTLYEDNKCDQEIQPIRDDVQDTIEMIEDEQ